MGRLGVVVGLVVLGVLVAGVFGAVHNQVSCTVSPEYFSRFKYLQFGIRAEVPLRLGAAMVGFLATWWMGLVIGPLLGITALGFSDLRRGWREALLGFGVVVGVAAVFSLFGLWVGFLLFPSEGSGASVVYGDVVDGPAFNRAGTMHNSSYFGGLVGAFLAWARILHRVRQERVADI